MSGSNFTASLNSDSNFTAQLRQAITTFNAEFSDERILYRGIKRVWLGDGRATGETAGQLGYLYAETVDNITTEVGLVSGYAYAVQQGFTGSYQDWVDTMLLASTHSEEMHQAVLDTLAYKEAAEDAAEDAEDSADDAEEQANRAAVWAVGSSSGDGDPSNNSKYWAEQSKSYANGKDLSGQDVQARATDNAKYYSEAAQTASGHFPRIGITGNWEVWNVSQNAFVDSGVHAQGPQGINTQIDDEAGHGDTDKAYSADKITGMFDEYTYVKEVDFGTVSSLPQTISDAEIDADMYVVDAIAGNPDAFVDEPSVTLADGSIILSGSLVSGASSTMKVYLSSSAIFCGEAVQLDATLSVRNKAAESKATGIAIRNRASAIKDLQTKYNWLDVKQITFNPGEYAWGNVEYADRENIIKGYEKSGTYGYADDDHITLTTKGNIIMIDGVRSSGGNDLSWWVHDVDMPVGSYTFTVEPGGNTAGIVAKNLHLDIWYDGESDYSRRITLSVGQTTQSATFTTTMHVYKIRLWTGFRNNTYDHYKLFYSLFPSDVTIVDTGHEVDEGETYTCMFDPPLENFCSMKHTSTGYGVIDTKEYVDEHLSNVHLQYYKPEDYGAVGDGRADDTEALQACIDASQAAYSAQYERRPCIRGYGTYLITRGIVFDGREQDVFINKIIYTGGDVAVTISSQFSKFVFQSIRAWNAGGAYPLSVNATGIRCLQSLTNTYFGNILYCNFIRTSGVGLEMVEAEGVNVGSLMYNEFHFQQQRSDNGNLIEINATEVNENVFYGYIVLAPNGYLLHYGQKWNGEKAQGFFKFYNYCLETNLKYGSNGYAYYYNCRFGEFVNQQTMEDHDTGILFNWTDRPPLGCIVNPTTGIDMTCVKTTYSWNRCLQDVKTKMETKGYSSNYWLSVPGASVHCPQFATFPVIRTCNAHMTTHGGMFNLLPGDMIVYFDHIAYKPYQDIYRKIDGDMTIELTESNNWEYITPTVFDIDGASVTIRLDYSYCILGIDHFDVIQHEDKTATIVDKLGNIIFDGTNLGPGVYHFKCSFVPTAYGDIQFTIEAGPNLGRVCKMPRSLLNAIYTGSNEKWTITKEELIEPPANQS